MSKSLSHSITIKDIAAHLGMNHSTVSRALNGHLHISPATKALVRETAEKMGYIPNLSARLIRGDADMLVGLIIPDVRNDFYSNIAKEIAARCRIAGLRMLLAITEDDPELEAGEVRALREARVSGVIMTLTSSPSEATLRLLTKLPAIQLVRQVKKVNAGTVCMADRAACAEATKHLIDLGHRRVAYVGTSKEISTGRDRVQGFIDALKQRGNTDAQNIVLVPPRQDFGYSAVERVLATPHRPTAILIGSSELTIGGLAAIRDAGLRIPEDISVIGYGDPPWFELTSPPLTAISLPVPEMADAAAAALFARLEQPATTVVANVQRITPHLKLRGSTAPPSEI